MIPAKGLKPRNFPCWIESFCDYTDNLPVSRLFRKWAGIITVAGALERKLWIAPFGPRLFPNFYIVLVAPASVGKTLISSVVSRFWRRLPDHYIAPSNVSRATLIDSLFDAKRRIIRLGDDPPYDEFNALNIAINELGVFIPKWDPDFMNHLTDIWDGKEYEERKRTGNVRIKIDSPVVNLFGCTTPSWLTSTMPITAWDGGFASRTIFIYSGEHILKDLPGLMPDFVIPEDAFESLLIDLKTISTLYGLVTFEPSTAEAIRKWHLAGGPPKPTHPKLETYCGRRTVHLLKLCMVLCAAKSNVLVITSEIYQEALSLLLQLEHVLPEVFLAITAGGDSVIMEELHHVLFQVYLKTNQPIDESILVKFLQKRVPSHSVMKILELMIRSGMIKLVAKGNATAYVPLGRRLTD